MPRDIVTELMDLLRKAGLEPWLHQHDCASWKKGKCDKGCSLELFRLQGVGIKNNHDRP
jgi:hypothetical protein